MSISLQAQNLFSGAQLIRKITGSHDRPWPTGLEHSRGGGTIYRCFALATLTATNDFARTQSCWQIDQTTATGYCYKDTVGDWYCGLLGTKTEWQANVLPPAGS
jgi:hypothetical protein